MILASFRRYSTHSLQQRISHLLKFIGHTDTYGEQSWRSVTSLPTLDSAVAHLESITGWAPPEGHAPFPSPLNPPPTWLLVRLCSKVKSPADAEKASHLIITYLPHVLPGLRPPVLILVAHLLSTHRVLPALDTLTLYTDSPTDGRYVARLAVLLLKTMTERELLLPERHIARFSKTVTSRWNSPKSCVNNPFFASSRTTAPCKMLPHMQALSTAWTRRMSRLIYQLLNKLGLLDLKWPIVPSATVEYLTQLVHENSQRTQFDADVECGLGSPSPQPFAYPVFSPKSLVAFFDWSHAQRFPFRTHTTLSYTIVLRGLLRKRAYALALELWERYRRHGTRKLHLDLIALGVGVEVLTVQGTPTVLFPSSTP
ncbi:hypothetical protein BJV77DRAFT_1072236 [Russula vinacea]|nr:hypothetical protein BJV77DRAFT_1072236 [Russula vinacea]